MQHAALRLGGETIPSKPVQEGGKGSPQDRVEISSTGALPLRDRPGFLRS